ncbi:hypothetical protein DPMN_185001 [Dreissena polymorpha]|uniref:Uncharacterized protein n=1 Tax=Dreissena polymorpha TaxID=45954 RepID=A0A9D4DK42_DREPO|nr:hypothetical protein DPMN_185001 [Dreissena polymorpha]
MHTYVVVVASRKGPSMIKHLLFDENRPRMSKTAKSFTNSTPKSNKNFAKSRLQLTRLI